MTPEQFESFAADTLARGRQVGGDVHVFVIVAPRGEDARALAPMSAGSLDVEGQIAVFRSIANSLERQSMKELFVHTVEESKP